MIGQRSTKLRRVKFCLAPWNGLLPITVLRDNRLKKLSTVGHPSKLQTPVTAAQQNWHLKFTCISVALLINASSHTEIINTYPWQFDAVHINNDAVFGYCYRTQCSLSVLVCLHTVNITSMLQQLSCLYYYVYTLY